MAQEPTIAYMNNNNDAMYRPHEAPSKTHAVKDKAVGGMKEEVGAAFHKPALEAEGAVQHRHGDLEQQQADLMHKHLSGDDHVISNKPPSKTHAKKDKVVGAVKEDLGNHLHKPGLEAEGAQQRMHGFVEESHATTGQPGYTYSDYDTYNRTVPVAATTDHHHKHHSHSPPTTHMTPHPPHAAKPINHSVPLHNQDGGVAPVYESTVVYPDHHEPHYNEEALHRASVLHASKNQIVGGLKLVAGAVSHKPDLEERGRIQKESGDEELREKREEHRAKKAYREHSHGHGILHSHHEPVVVGSETTTTVHRSAEPVVATEYTHHTCTTPTTGAAESACTYCNRSTTYREY